MELVVYPRNILEKLSRLLDSHLQYVIHVFLFVFYFQCFLGKTLPFADVADYMHRGEKVHLNADYSVPLGVFASAPFYVKAESSGLVAAPARVFRRK